MGIKFAKAAASAIREEYVQKMDGNIQFSVLALMRITVQSIPIFISLVDNLSGNDELNKTITL